MCRSERNRHSNFGRLMVFLCLLFLTVPCAERTALADTPETKTVRVGYYENEVFQEGAGEGAVKTGYAYEYYRKLSEYTGWKYEYVYDGFGELYQMLLDGKIDLLAGLAYRDDRAGLIGYPDAVMGNEFYYLMRHDSDEQTTTEPSTLNGKRIGVLESAMVDVLEQYLSDHDVKAQVITFSDHVELFDAFDSQELDILAVESDGAYGREHAEILGVFGASDYYLCVSRSREDLLEELNLAQAQMAVEEPNYISFLQSKYYSVSVTSRAFSSAERDWLDAHSVLRIGYLENYLPYSDTDTDGQVTGLVKDLVPDILKSLGAGDITVSYSGYNRYDDMISDMGAGVIDAAFPVGGGLYYSEENGIYQSAAVVSASTELVFKGEFREETIQDFAVNENNRMQYYYVRTNYPEAKITEYPSIEDCLEAVLSGKAACTTLNGLRANDILKNKKYEGLSMRQSTRNDDRCFGVEIGNEGLLKLLNRGVNVLGSEYAQNLSNRYMEGLYSYSFADMLQEHMVFFGSIVLLIAVLVIFLLIRDRRRSRDEIRQKEEAAKNLEEKNRELAGSKSALSEALVAAESANRAKTTFLNNMSHDIRTPMNAIVGFTALAASHIDDKEQVQDYLGKISVSSQHLLSLINDVLDMSSIESGKVTIEESDVHLPDVIHDLSTMIQSNIAGRELDFSVELQGVVHEDIVTDKLRLSQILLNILSNAIKFTPDGGAISLQVIEKASAGDPADFEFRIKDTGIGMSKEFQETIFEAFTREKTSTVSGIQGTGLGMAITKNIVDMMGGTIRVQSEEGKGSEFIVELSFMPCKTPVPDNSEEAVAPEFGGKRVLLAEDNEMNQMIAEAILTEAGLAVEIASDGREAVDMMAAAAAGYYDVVLMDIQMPRMDGYEATRQIRAMDDPGKAGIPIIAVTANAFEEDRSTALEAGMSGHLAKPYDVRAIMETLDRLLNKQETQWAVCGTEVSQVPERI